MLVISLFPRNWHDFLLSSLIPTPKSIAVFPLKLPLYCPCPSLIILEWICIMQLRPWLLSSWVAFTYKFTVNWLKEDFLYLYPCYLLSHIPCNVQGNVSAYVFNLSPLFIHPPHYPRLLSLAWSLAVFLFLSYSSLLSRQQWDWCLFKVNQMILLISFKCFYIFPLHLE